MPIRSIAISTAAAALLSSAALAGGLQNGWKSFRDPTIQDYGYEWAKVGHAGNADWVSQSDPFHTVRTGGVDYRYRIAKTEVTNRQWFEFVQAYAPYVSPQFSGSSQFTGLGVGLSGGGGYSLAQETAEHGAEVGWRFAARYTNWLHNRKVNEAWAFESGVYDTSTFGTVGIPATEQRERSEGARFFLPTRDEWAKAVHFDPDRYGEGQEGYWLYTYSSDTAPVPGAPGVPEAQTNRGAGFTVPIMSYPDMQTPWGLYDASGSVLEWLENISGNATGRLAESSNRLTPSGANTDHIFLTTGGSPTVLIGIRLASVIPAPGGSLVVGLFVAAFGARRRREARPSSSN